MFKAWVTYGYEIYSYSNAMKNGNEYNLTSCLKLG